MAHRDIAVANKVHHPVRTDVHRVRAAPAQVPPRIGNPVHLVQRRADIAVIIPVQRIARGRQRTIGIDRDTAAKIGRDRRCQFTDDGIGGVKLRAVDRVGGEAADVAGRDVDQLPFGSGLADADHALGGRTLSGEGAVGNPAHRRIGFGGGSAVGGRVAQHHTVTLRGGDVVAHNKGVVVGNRVGIANRARTGAGYGVAGTDADRIAACRLCIATNSDGISLRRRSVRAYGIGICFKRLCSRTQCHGVLRDNSGARPRTEGQRVLTRCRCRYDVVSTDGHRTNAIRLGRRANSDGIILIGNRAACRATEATKGNRAGAGGLGPRTHRQRTITGGRCRRCPRITTDGNGIFPAHRSAITNRDA